MGLTSLARGCVAANILEPLLFGSKQFAGSSRLLPARYLSVTQSRNMRLVQYTYEGCSNAEEEIRAGIMLDNCVVDINKANSKFPVKLIDILRSGLFDELKSIPHNETIPLNMIRLAAPITKMDKVICIGLNYKDHCEEQKLPIPEVPMFFSKFASTVIGPCDAVKLRTDVTKCVDWEVELAVVIGRKASNVSRESAYEYVAGYTVAQDISARDWQKKKNGGQFLLGKAQDTFCPIGPWIVTHDEICDPEKLKIQCRIEGVTKQDSNTCQLITKIPDAIARLTSVMTLIPGDIILTGTPGGVGMYRDPPEYLTPGITIESEIEKIGVLRTKCEQF